MASIIQLFIFSAVIFSVLGTQNSISNGPDAYFQLMQSELLNKIELTKQEVDALDERHKDRLALIELQHRQLLNETQQVNQTLIPLQALSFAWKYCIQEYDSQWNSVGVAQQKLQGCVDRYRNNGGYYYYTRSSLTSAKSYVLNQLAKSVDNCSCKNQTKMEECYIARATYGTQVVQGYIDSARNDMKTRFNNVEDNTLQVVKCSLDIQKDIFENMFTYKMRVSDCVSELNKKEGSIVSTTSLRGK